MKESEKEVSAKTKNAVESEDKRNLFYGLGFGIVFGFLLHKGGATKYDVIVAQLLLTDFTVLQIMLSAVATGMVGVYFMKSMGWIKLSIKSGSVGMNVLGASIFGVGFAVLGYCPGTIAGAVGNGYLDAITGGLAGIVLGTWIFAIMYPNLKDGILKKGYFGDLTLPGLLKVNDWMVVAPAVTLIVLVLFWIESAGL
ncbi:YeeE/YedE thiosulfate transporter family protein [Cyclobacterium jeungdonense]|uniref:YeeE/YedE thiosulfate transporter family protein n=1 Tax=Cyclobacterium jeungdonense TaxID=708087 RepID=A0ABT8CEG9_9BACT|nr:YeeE/YedE thiosulfate transporter family protein [Cyclobacterium jeungdonense]MDN3690120.1 YeeE/YedE thiosulfate transporter family protein [Cyclobacterium jeungdonense]